MTPTKNTELHFVVNLLRDWDTGIPGGAVYVGIE
jgi:hypothetical protein